MSEKGWTRGQNPRERGIVDAHTVRVSEKAWRSVARGSEETDSRTIRVSERVGRTQSALARKCGLEDKTRFSEGSPTRGCTIRVSERVQRAALRRRAGGPDGRGSDLITVSTGGRVHTGICAVREAGITLSTSGAARVRDKLR